MIRFRVIIVLGFIASSFAACRATPVVITDTTDSTAMSSVIDKPLEAAGTTLSEIYTDTTTIKTDAGYIGSAVEAIRTDVSGNPDIQGSINPDLGDIVKHTGSTISAASAIAARVSSLEKILAQMQVNQAAQGEVIESLRNDIKSRNDAIKTLEDKIISMESDIISDIVNLMKWGIPISALMSMGGFMMLFLGAGRKGAFALILCGFVSGAVNAAFIFAIPKMAIVGGIVVIIAVIIATIYAGVLVVQSMRKQRTLVEVVSSLDEVKNDLDTTSKNLLFGPAGVLATRMDSKARKVIKEIRSG